MLNHRIQFMKRGSPADSIGQPSKTFVFVREVWANVKFQTGAEVVRADAQASVVKASIRIRACADIDVGWRVVYGARMFEIKAPPLPDQDPHFAFLVCEAIK